MNGLYTYTNLKVESGQLTCSLQVDVDHPVFRGHFPSQPVMPGVCMIQMMTDVMSDYLNLELELSRSSMIKFINMWIPATDQLIEMKVQYEKSDQGHVIIKNGLIHNGETILFKLKGSLNERG